MTNLDDLIAVPSDVTQPAKRQYPSGWEPRIEGNDDTGTAVTRAITDRVRDYDELLTSCDLDPDVFEVIEPVRFNRWQGYDGRWLRQDKFAYRRRTGTSVDLTSLMKTISSHRYRRPTDVAEDVTSALVVCLADWQTGPDPEGLVEQILRLKDAVVDRLKATKPDVLHVVGMGDMVEGCDGHYAMQTFATGAGGLNGRRDQVKLVRRLLVELLTEWARHVPSVIVGAVPGNHGENRRDGKAYTTFDDNDDLAVFEQAAEVLGANPDAYGHVRFVLPDGDMSLTLDVAGTTVAFIHGHQATRGGATPQQKLLAWWKGKQHAQHRAGDAAILVNGHYHHLCLVEDGPRTWIQAPALAQSRWWEETGGSPTACGTLSFTVGPDGWDGLRILR